MESVLKVLFGAQCSYLVVECVFSCYSAASYQRREVRRGGGEGGVCEGQTD